jgi:hypothetical protein
MNIQQIEDVWNFTYVKKIVNESNKIKGLKSDPWDMPKCTIITHNNKLLLLL